MQALLGFTSEARHARKHLTSLFPYLPGPRPLRSRLMVL
jgi:hypothetical protein